MDTALLKLSPRTHRALTRALNRAAALSEGGPDAGEALDRLMSEARMLEACAAQATAGPRLPGRRGTPRLLVLARRVLNGGEAPLTKAALLEALDAGALTMAELWAVPLALRVAIAEAAAQTARAIVADAGDRLSAQRWTRRAFTAPRRPSPAFCEHALALCAERGARRPRALLETALRRAGTSPDFMVRQAHAARAHQRLRLENLSAARRLLDELDWQAIFEALSEADAALRRDPAGVYPLMDDASRQRVRDQVALIARATGLSERAVAEQAVAAARRVRGLALVKEIGLDQLADEAPDPKATCCWWLCDDAGRVALLRAMDRPEIALPRLVPDPRGYKTMTAIAGVALVLVLVLVSWLKSPILLPALIPAAWTAADALVGKCFPRFARPATLLKLDIPRLPDPWRTLLVIPVLLTDARRAGAMCDALETLGCLETDPNLSFLLLGDFSDADAEHCPGDAAILQTARSRVAEMNRRAGWEKYHYLHRPRTLLEADGRWMGRDRKRGALMDLNRLLTGGESAFTAEGASAEKLKNRFAYVLTLDADTRMLPGTVHRLVGAAAHPMNRRYAVLQPRMEVLPSAIQSRFARLFTGPGGVDAYPTAASSLWMDLTGEGVYGGKGLYNIEAFQNALDGALPEGRILSHDLIEGALAGTACTGDIALYDGCPATLNGWMRRLHRWTRGDWQLLPLLLGARLHLDPADRFRMADNLLRSLRAPALWALFACAAWTGRGEPLAAGLLLTFWEALLNRALFPRALAELAILPLNAWQMADAIGRALWRQLVSGKRLLDWVPSADAEGRGHRLNLPNRIAALLMLPGLRHPAAIPMALGLFALFWTGADWVADMAGEPIEGSLSEGHAELLRALARDAWRFFSENTAALPPDNVQLDPPVGAARRTSPTNIGLYLLSCAAAQMLGFIGQEERDRRIERTLDALDEVEKWRGHLFNWIDIDTLTPLRPRYVSAVDSGNLAACALACASLVPEPLSERLRGLAEGADFRALYDERRHLFHIGYDADARRLSQSHYDLMASEARTLSLTALLLGQVPMKHWRHLGRACGPVGKGAALLSWSGTLFEYLMPELLFRAPALSLTGQSARAAVDAQRAHSLPWGVSESGFHAFDGQMNYQYRAFGLPELALSGEAAAGVIAPYAAALALAVAPDAAAEDLAHMVRLGWRGEYGLFEAADYARPNLDGTPALIRSHMAHHQGMLLCAICNALTGDALARAMGADPRARAVALLLEERPACRARLKPLLRPVRTRRIAPPVKRLALPTLSADVHLLTGREAHAFVTADGAVHYARSGIDATRFGYDLIARPDAAKLYVRVNGRPCDIAARAAYPAGSAQFDAAPGPVKLRMTVSLSPEDDTLFRQVALKNASAAAVRVELLDLAPVALARPGDFLDHPAFQMLFVEAAALEDDGLIFRRRSRNPGEQTPVLVHRVKTEGAVLRETCYENVVTRGGEVKFELSGDIITTPLDPVSALLVRRTLGPGETAEVCFALKLSEAPSSGGPERAAQLARARMEAMLGFMGIPEGQYHRLDRLSALLLDPRLAAGARLSRKSAEGMERSALWSMGISGDRPLLVLRATDPAQTAPARAMLRAQGFYRAMGLQTDLVLVDDGPSGYQRPVREMLQAQLYACALREDALILQDLTEVQRAALQRAAAIHIDADKDFAEQVRTLLSALEVQPPEKPLDPGPSTLLPAERFMDNGFGGFIGTGYEIDVTAEHPTPAPWCHMLANEAMGLLLTERGGGFLWHGNSRSGRLTPWRGDPLREGFGLTLTLRRAKSGEALSLLPGERPAMPFRVRYAPDRAVYAFSTARLSGETALSLRGDLVILEIALKASEPFTANLSVRWLMGTDVRDACWLRTWRNAGVEYASGIMPGMGFATCDPVPVKPGENRLRFAVGWAKDGGDARERARRFLDGETPPAQAVPRGLVFDTPDKALNRMMNRFLPHQVRASRVLGRTGYYQPGGAYGFRDQLQDMLALIPTDPGRVREHLLLCAGRQFAAGDVLHWWHMPYLGVRTRISDDRLFLPFVTAAYVAQTGDRGVLDEIIPYLADIPIPEGREDVFQAMAPGDEAGTLHDHCMRAFRATDVPGGHGLARMGAGDWNDGMNRVGAQGRGESVWLSMFLSACAEDYAAICPDPDDAARLRALACRHRTAVERHGWDGAWYLRAYADDDTALGGAASPACKIDLLPQAWAVLAGLDAERARAAVDAAWDRLVDEEHGLIRLLDPPFPPEGFDPGYIRGYPPGVRENGAQYTHGACWLLLALIRLGDADRAHRALHMLLPPNHADTPEKAERYRVEPYVLAGDVCALPGREGRGGWTWYTGSAAWLIVCVLALLGYERQGDRVRLRALLGPWPRASVTLPFGASLYRLTCDRDAQCVTLDGFSVEETFIHLIDDGRPHEAVFPAAKG